MNINNFNLQGYAKLELKEYNSHGILETVSTSIEKNIVLKEAYWDIMNSSVGGFLNNTSHRICISSESANPTFSKTEFTSSVFATGDPTPFLSTQSYIRNIGEIGSSINPPSVTYLQRFVAPSANRTINSIGISKSASTLIVNSTNTTITGLKTYLKLATPILQTTTQVLDITYKVFIDWSNITVTPKNIYHLYTLSQSFVGFGLAGGFPEYNTDLVANKIETGFLSNDNITGFSLVDRTFSLFFPSSHFTSTNSSVELSISRAGNGSLTLSNPTTSSNPANISPNFIGRFISHILFGATRPIPNYQIGLGYKIKLDFQKTSNLSSITSHSINSTRVTYDANELANSSWQPVISDAGSPTDFPSTYILKVTTPGGVGVGRYKIYKTGWGGWSRGFWKDPIADKFLCLDLSRKECTWTPALAADNYDFYNYRWMYKWSSTIGSEQFVSYRRDKGVGIYEITDRALNVIYTRTLSQINNSINKIFDIAVVQSLNLIYIATDAGLFTLDTLTNTVNTLSSDKCLAVCVGLNNNAFAAFNPAPGVGRISGSIGTNWQTPLIIGTPSPSINWNNIWRLFIDKESSNYNMMIIEGVTPKGIMLRDTSGGTAVRYRYRWWENTNGVVNTISYSSTVSGEPLISDLYMFPTHNSVMCTGGVWLYPNQILPSRNVPLNIMMNFPKDIREDFISSNMFSNNFPSNINNIVLGTHTTDLILGNTGGINISNSRPLCKARVAVSLFNGTVLASIQTNAGGVGDLIKPKLNTDGTVFNLIFTMSDHYTTYASGPTAEQYNQDVLKYAPLTMNSPSTLISNSTYVVPTRTTLFYVVNVDLTTTPAATILNYPEYGTTAEYCVDIQRAGLYGNVISTYDKRILIADMQSPTPGAGFRMFATIRNPVADLNTELCQAWDWNGTAWVDDPSNTGQGKLLHTSTDNLVDGLTINWVDLQPGNSKNLIAGQYYTMSRCTAPNQVPFDNHTPTPSVKAILSPRTKSGTITDTFTNINNVTPILYLSKAPLGSVPDPNYFGLGDNTTFSTTKTATLNGTPISVGTTNSTPPAGQINIETATGRIRSNIADNGKTLVINYQYLFKLDPSELPA